MKIAWVTPTFKGGEVSDLGNYRPIFLCYFSKMLEKNLFKCLYKHLLDNNILYNKQIGFQEYLQLITQLFN